MKTESIKLGELGIVHAPEIDMYSMTALWKVAGSERIKAPNFWLNQETTKDYLKALQQKNLVNCNPELQFKSCGWKGTYANWMILGLDLNVLRIILKHYKLRFKTVI